MMFKKTYNRPTIDVLQVDTTFMLANSQSQSPASVNVEGLDEEDEMKYGDGDKKSGSAWDAW